jgi:hypothetical protein
MPRPVAVCHHRQFYCHADALSRCSIAGAVIFAAASAADSAFFRFLQLRRRAADYDFSYFIIFRRH